jgi:hypothetical protein
VDEFAVLKEEIGKAQKSLKGKNVKFVIDKEGNLLTVDPVKPESLPPFAVPLGTNISEGSRDLDEGGGSRRSVSGKKAPLRVAGAPSVPAEDLYFKASNTLASTLAGGETIAVLQPGVSVQSGETVRAGPEPLPDPKKPSRKEYMRSGAASTLGFEDASYLDSPTSSAVLRAPLLDSPNADDSFVTNISVPPSSSGFRLPDIDVMEGSRRIFPLDSVQSPGEENDEETATMGSSNLQGLSASRLPMKPSDKQKHIVSLIHGGPDVGGNRDRDSPISMVPPPARIKLPAPPIGHTTGHGMAPVMGSPLERGSAASFASASYASSKAKISVPSKASLNPGGVIKKERPDIARQIA